MHRYIVTRLLLAVPTLVGAAALVFVLMRLIPGDVRVVRLGSSGGTFDPKANLLIPRRTSRVSMRGAIGASRLFCRKVVIPWARSRRASSF